MPSSNIAPALSTTSTKRHLEASQSGEAEDIEAKRRRVLEETRDIDAESDDSKNESSDEDRYFHRSEELRLLLVDSVAATTKKTRLRSY